MTPKIEKKRSFYRNGIQVHRSTEEIKKKINITDGKSESSG